MMSIMAVDCVTSFLRFKDTTNTCISMFAKQSNFWWDFFSAMAESWKKLKALNAFLSLTVCSNQNRSALVRDLLSNNLLFVGLLHTDKWLVLLACDLIIFTTDLHSVLLLNKSLLSLLFS